MKKIFSLLSILALSAVSFTTIAGPQAIVVGNGNRSISIIDMKSKQTLWQHEISEEDKKCNSVTLLDDGEHIAFATLTSAQVVSIKSNEVVWEYRPEGFKTHAEVHSVVSLGKEGFAVFVAREPVLVLEVSPDFKTTKEIEFSNFRGARNPHSMFRLVSMSKDGNYLFRWSPDGLTYRVNRQGEVVETYNTQNSGFGITELKNGNFLFSTTDNGEVVEYNPTTDSVIHKITSFSKSGESAWIQCIGQCLLIDKDRYLVTNWIGHQKRQRHMDNKKEFVPALMVVDGTGEILWHYTLEEATEQLDLMLGSTGIYYSKKAIIK